MEKQKLHINYGVKRVDEISPFNTKFYGWLVWFDGENIVGTESNAINNQIDCWKWVADKLKEFNSPLSL